MKKILFFLSIALFFFTATHAQISKGSIWLGGNLAFGTKKNSNDYYLKTSTYSIYPAIGLAIRTNNVMGIEIRFAGSHYESKYDTSNSSGRGIGLWDRQYWSIIKRLYVFADFKGTYDGTKDETRGGTATSTHSTGWTAGLSASPGVSFEVTKWFYLESGFNNLFYFNYSKQTNTSTNPVNPGGSITYDSHSASGGVSLDGESAFTVGVRFMIAKG